MKNKASAVFKRIVSLLSSLGKVKDRLSNAAKILALINNKKLLMDSLSHKVQNLLGHRRHGQSAVEDLSKAIVLYNAGPSAADMDDYVIYQDNDDNKYPDLRHSLFEEFDENEVIADLQRSGGSVIEMVRSSKEEEGEDFRLEDEIDHVADLFIDRFHKQMRLQKLHSFKRYQEMMERSV